MFKNKYIDVGKLPLSFFCAAFRKETFDQIGFLDEDFGMGLGDDDEYCYRLRAHNLKLVLSLETFVFHHHRTTFKALKLPVDKIRRRNIHTLRAKKKAIMKELND
jgi:GT2 family glycosyltransferase